MSSILTNNGAMVALQTMNMINKDLGEVQDMISTGKRVSDAKDNAAIWAISTTMESDVSSLKAVGDSLALGESTVSVARNASEQVTSLLQEMKTKIVSAQEENVDRDKIQADVVALRDQISSVVNAAQFNGLNLLKGTANIDILGSLDRDSNGNVNTSDITIQRNNLEQTASVFGNGSAIAETDATGLSNNSLVVTDNLDVLQTALLTFAETGLGFANTNQIDLVVSGQTFSVLFETGADGSGDSASLTEVDATGSATDVAAAFATLISNAISSDSGSLNGSGVVSATASLGVLTINTQSSSTTDVSVAGNTTIAGTIAIAGANTNADIDTAVTTTAITTSAQSANIDDATNTLTLTAGQVSEGDSYRIALNGTNYEYVARQNENLNDVAEGLKTVLDAAGITGLGVTVNRATDPTAQNVTLDLQLLDPTQTSDQALTVASAEDGTAGGGLEQLANIDVSTSAGAASALVFIEDLIETSIDAASAFGSDEKRLEIQNDFISKLTDSLTSGIGTLVDADMEETAARLQALQVQQQLGTQALSIANQSPQNILALFR
ncbi:MAG: flagellin [Pseudomonadota bacterium]